MIGTRELQDLLARSEPSDLEQLAKRHDRYESALCERVQQVAAALGCPWPETAASCWEFLEMNDFYADDRHPLPTAIEVESP